MRPSPLLRRRLTVHRLTLKLTLVTLLLMGSGVGVVVLAGGALPWWGWLLLLLGLGALAYGLFFALIARRLDLARDTLRQLRKHQFDNLDAVYVPHGDELNALTWQVYRTGQALEKDFQELKRIENYRRDFLGHVSHELKTPIFAIRGFAETLLGGALDDDTVRRSFTEKILRNARRLENLTRDLAEVSRIEMGELEMRMAPFALAPMIREVVESLEPAAQAAQTSLAAHLPEVVPAVLGDGERIRQVLLNLMENAIKYNRPGGHVEVVARVLPRGAVRLAVVDNGIGIAPQHLPRLTERFYRVDASRSRAQGGTGLGLAIVKHILHAHQRELRIESRPERGSTFSFTLPIYTEAAAAVQPA